VGEVTKRSDGGGYQVTSENESGGKIVFSINEQMYQLLVQQGHIKPNNRPGPGPIANTVGIIVPKTLPWLSGGEGRMPEDQPETEQEKNNDEAERILDELNERKSDVRQFFGKAKGTWDSANQPLTSRLAELHERQRQLGALEPGTPLGDYDISGLGEVLDNFPSRRGLWRSKTKAKNAAAKQNNNGGRVDGPSDCRLRPYGQGCPNGRTPHHVVPDHCFKQPGDDGAYYKDAIQHADGLSICVGGATKSTAKDGSTARRGNRSRKEHYNDLADHGKIHAMFDPLEKALGAKGNPPGTAKLGDLERVGTFVVAKVTGCDRKDLLKQLRDYHQSKGLGPDTKLRADPFGKVKGLDPGNMGTGGSGRE
jgi:hypothetical protein